MSRRLNNTHHNNTAIKVCAALIKAGKLHDATPDDVRNVAVVLRKNYSMYTVYEKTADNSEQIFSDKMNKLLKPRRKYYFRGRFSFDPAIVFSDSMVALVTRKHKNPGRPRKNGGTVTIVDDSKPVHHTVTTNADIAKTVDKVLKVVQEKNLDVKFNMSHMSLAERNALLQKWLAENGG